MTLAILIPSRGRPARFAELVHAIRETADTQPRIYLGTDDDDPPYSPLDGVTDVRGPRLRLSAKSNRLARVALDDGHHVIGCFGDDHRPRTPGWDTQIVEALDRVGSGLAYGRDGIQNERLPTAPFWTADIIQALGWYCVPSLTHMYIDDYWKLLADDLDRRAYLPDVYIEHCHPSVGKTAADALNAENDSYTDHDRAVFEQFVATSHPAVLRRVREALCSTR